MLKLLLCLRYLRKCKIVFLSVAAVAISVALLVGVSSLFTGFIHAFSESASQVMGDILIQPPQSFPRADQLIQQLERSPVVEAAAPSLQVTGLIRLGTGDVRQVEVWGIDPQAMARVTGLRGFLDREADDPHLNFGPGQAERLGSYVGIGLLVDPNEITDEYDWAEARAQLGQNMLLFTGAMGDESEEQGPANQTPKRKTIRLTLVDIVFSGFYLLDSSVAFLPLEPLHEQLYPQRSEVQVDRIHVKLAPGIEPLAALEDVSAVFAEFARQTLQWDEWLITGTDVKTARAEQAAYLMEVNKQMEILLAVFGLVDVAVVFLIFCVFWLIVGIKRKDIAVIKSCGASGLTVAGIFLGFGAMVGMVGGLLGVGLGWLFIQNINTIEQVLCQVLGIKIWSSSLYMLHEIPHRFDLGGAVGIVLVGIVAACAGALIPAWAAACTRPVRILRYE